MYHSKLTLREFIAAMHASTMPQADCERVQLRIESAFFSDELDRRTVTEALVYNLSQATGVDEDELRVIAQVL